MSAINSFTYAPTLQPTQLYSMRVQFASDYVCERVFTKLDAKHREELQSFVCHTSSEGLYGPLRGHLFEMIAHQMLAQGGSFNIRCLSRNNVSQSVLDMNQMASMKFDVVSDIENGKCCRPKRKNFNSVDAIVAPDKLFQITTSRHQPIKMNGLNKTSTGK
ncbi:1952_t:CDS:1 [Paraglomus occultum]|uniref:1952_t:CDS:1 n=1 Tax=Paraglomus occultum TaxID=144539 RepID=A0A9N9CU96_9GLOM|nr:1952_t:CDS:1 [Paraglomus occultum]